jgi:hypothetical protein
VHKTYTIFVNFKNLLKKMYKNNVDDGGDYDDNHADDNVSNIYSLFLRNVLITDMLFLS